jgi:threonine dehydrogenase-like Zn-dependent dehydrogenase
MQEEPTLSEQHTTKMMDALVWTGPHDMVLRGEPVPDLAPGEVLLEVGAVGICGSELSGYQGHNSLRRPPLIMGHEAAGRVATTTDAPFADGRIHPVGTPVTFNPLVSCGQCDRCTAGYANLCRARQLLGAHRPGAFARYVAVPVQQCWPMPPDLPMTTASLTEPLACAVHAIALSRIGAGQRLLILGAGSIGLCCLAAARAHGIQNITISDVDAHRLAVAQQWGAQATVNAREQDVDAVIQQIHPGGVDAMIDAVGVTPVRTQAINAVVPGGTVVLVGLHDEASLLPANYLVRQEVTLVGSFAYTPDDFKRALDLLIQGRVQPTADWLHERPLSEGPAAFAELVNGRAGTTKIVLRVP